MSVATRRSLLRRRSPGAARIGSRVGYRTRTLGLAAGLAVLTMVVTAAYLRGYERRVRAGVADTQVVVASRDIPAGTAGSTLRGGGFVRTLAVPRDAVAPGAVSSVGEVARLVTRQPIYAGEQITVRRFESALEQGLRGELSGTLRAQRVAGDPNQLLAGIVRTGDRVDVVAAIPPASGAFANTRVILRNLLVLQAPDSGLSSKATAVSAVLALTDEQAQRLFYAMKNGQWSLLLRPAGRASDSPGGTDTATTVLGGSG